MRGFPIHCSWGLRLWGFELFGFYCKPQTQCHEGLRARSSACIGAARDRPQGMYLQSSTQERANTLPTIPSIQYDLALQKILLEVEDEESTLAICKIGTTKRRPSQDKFPPLFCNYMRSFQGIMSCCPHASATRRLLEQASCKGFMRLELSHRVYGRVNRLQG